MIHVMLDLETLSTDPHAVVLSIGAVAFYAPTLDVVGEFYRVLDVDDQIRAGRQISGSTLGWWMRQDSAARTAAIFNQEPVPQVLAEFRKFYRHDWRAEGIWSNGAAFDDPILSSLYTAYGSDVPWNYGHSRCFRTVRAMFDPEGEHRPEMQGTHHNALDDAKYQLAWMREIRRQRNVAFR